MLRVQLNTVDEERVAAFESDPCAMKDRYDPVLHEGAYYYRYGRPIQCVCEVPLVQLAFEFSPVPLRTKLHQTKSIEIHRSVL